MSGPWGRGSAHSIASRASGTIKARSMRAAMLSAHHQPKAQVTTSPTNTATWTVIEPMVDAGHEHGVARRSVVERSRRVALHHLEGVGHHHERGARDRAGFATTRSTTERLATPAVDASLDSLTVRSALGSLPCRHRSQNTRRRHAVRCCRLSAR
jgi:hypothetical protein